MSYKYVKPAKANRWTCWHKIVLMLGSLCGEWPALANHSEYLIFAGNVMMCNEQTPNVSYIIMLYMFKKNPLYYIL